MDINHPTIGGKLQDRCLSIGLVVVLIALLVRNGGIYPVVFADEYCYSMSSRFLPLADSSIPGYIYLAIYRATNVCGDGFLACARLLNVLFFVASAPFLYLTARRVCTRGVASTIAMLALAGPINTYTAYYMPESLYFFSFWLLTWFVLQLDESASSKAWSFAGVILGLSALIKPHALLLLPAIVVYVFYVGRKKEGKWAPHAFWNAIALVAFSVLIKLSIGYLLAGKAGLTLFGPCYTSIATSTASQWQRCHELLASSMESVRGHALAICLMFGVPIVVAIIATFGSAFSRAGARSDQKMSFYALAVLVSLVLVAGLFTASVRGAGPYESMARLHMRYYNFALPLLLVIAASQLSLQPIDTSFRWRALTALPIGAAIIYAVCTRLAPYTPFLVDSPELRGFTYQSTVFYILSAMSFFALALWVHSTRAGARMFVYVLMPLTVVFSSVYVNGELRSRLVPDVFDKAGICTRQYLSKQDLSKVVILGSDASGLYKSLFHLDNPQAALQMIPKGRECDWTTVPGDKEWALVIGDHPLPDNTLFELPMNGFTLARIRGTNTIDFRASAWPGVIANARGLCSVEPWGTWSSDAVVTLRWVKPLPRKFTVHLVAHAFGPNVGKEFVAHVGDEAARFTLGASPEAKVLEFSNPNKCRIMKIDVPSPTSPKELGLSADERCLGIAFTELRIAPLE
jgi:phosphoglycerol transferase